MKPFLNTRSIKGFIPQLYEKYPDRPIRISLETFKAPTFKLTPGQAEAALYVRAGINVELADKSLVSVFHLDLRYKFDPILIIDVKLEYLYVFSMASFLIT